MMNERISKNQLDKIIEMSDKQLEFLNNLFRECQVTSLFAQCVEFELHARARSQRQSEESVSA